MRYKQDDITLLVPAFRERVEKLLHMLRVDGFVPVLRDGLRTRAEAEANARKGVGIVDSMHCYGIAADLICDEHGWDCARQGCNFFTALGENAKDLGLTWGGDWKRRDLPHVQAVPVGLQNAIRKMPADQIDGFVRKHFEQRGRP